MNFSNIDWQSWTGSGNKKNTDEKFIDVLQKWFKTFVMEPTRYRATDEPHVLDLIISRDDIVSNLQHMPPLGKSDHAVLSFCCVKTVSASHASSYNYQKGKYDELRNSLDIDWDQALCPEDNNVDEMWHLLKNKLLLLYKYACHQP